MDSKIVKILGWVAFLAIAAWMTSDYMRAADSWSEYQCAGPSCEDTDTASSSADDSPAGTTTVEMTAQEQWDHEARLAEPDGGDWGESAAQEF